MSIWFRDKQKIDQERALLDYVERLARFRRGRRAVHLHLSKLRPYHRREHHLRFTANILDQLVKRFAGSLFWLSDDDMVLVTNGATVAQIDEAVLRLRFLFSEDPLLDRGAEREAEFCSWYDLETDYDALLAVVRSLQATGWTAPAATTADPAVPEGEPLDPVRLAQVERGLANADLSNFLRRQPVCFVAPGQAPVPLFEELYVSIADLRDTVLPAYDIAANRWLFQHLTRTLDLRMLALLARRDPGVPLKDFSVNLNVATILAPEFLEFDADMTGADRGTVAIEIQQIDIFADFGSYVFARDYLKERDYKLCLDGVKHQTLPLLDRERLGVDLVKFLWGPDLADDLEGPRGAALEESVKRIGRDRLVLCRCDSPRATEVGEALGITMFQGRYFDGLLRAAAQPRMAVDRAPQAVAR